MGYVQCFCDEQSALGELPTKGYGPHENYQICLEYNE